MRADADVCKDLGRKIIRSLPTEYTHQLYTGHRGGGKSTELLRLKKHLEQNNCFVVYFAADEDKYQSRRCSIYRYSHCLYVRTNIIRTV
ncbi:MAG UNVERIFIED_CONTAM: hypothetical protein LVR29_26535 [Microcystis novacekii LVE1205-3]